MTVCREYNATPAIMVALATSKAIADIYPDYDKPINANIATDMRRALGTENTYKNCVLSMILPYDRQFASFLKRAGGKIPRAFKCPARRGLLPLSGKRDA